MEKVSVIIPTLNEERYIKRCIDSLLAQSYPNFELLIIDNCSTDKTCNIVNSYKDRRIRCIRNSKRYNIPESRNIGIKRAKGRYIFFTDADCIPSLNWIAEGVKVLKQDQFVGVQGKTYYETSFPTISDRVVQPYDFEYATCNIAYTKKILEKVQGFDESYYCVKEDMDLAFRILSFGGIYFSKKMRIIHQRKFWNIKALINQLERGKIEIIFFKKLNYYPVNKLTNDQKDLIKKYKSKKLRGRIYDIGDFLTILFPFRLATNYKINLLNKKHLKDFFLCYIKLILLRFIYWKTAFEERIFII